jgi:hypothetical protein
MASAPVSLTTPSFGEAGRGLLRLFRIEVRRSLGLLLFPVLVGMSWFVADQQPYFDKPQGVALWPADSLRVSFASVLVAPFVAALLSWEAGRDRRRHIDDLLITTPRPAFARDLARWAGTSAWALLAYSGVGLAVLIPTARAATWGGPLNGALLVGVVLVPAAGAVGYLTGMIFPSRFTPPLVGIGVYAIEVGIAGLQPTNPFSTFRFLSPFTNFVVVGGSQTGLFREVDLARFGWQHRALSRCPSPPREFDGHCRIWRVAPVRVGRGFTPDRGARPAIPAAYCNRLYCSHLL